VHAARPSSTRSFLISRSFINHIIKMFTPPASPLPPRLSLMQDEHDDNDDPLSPSQSLLVPLPRPSRSPSPGPLLPHSTPADLHPPQRRKTKSLTDPDLLIPQRQALSRKKDIGKQFRILVLLVPALLVLFTLATRYLLSCPHSHQIGTEDVDSSTVLDYPDLMLSSWKHTFIENFSRAWSHRRGSHPKAHRLRRHNGGKHPVAPQQSNPASSSSPPDTGSVTANGGINPSNTLSSGSSSTSSSAPVATVTALPTVPPSSPPPPIPNPFPQPFDVSLSANFTSSTCLAFFVNFTQDLNFRSCRSFALLLANSQAFAEESNYTAMNLILWGTCNTKPTVDECIIEMDNLATELRSECSADLQAGNALAVAALVGFSSYELYNEVACLINPRDNTYCYLEALADSSPDDLYFYSLPLGIALPNTTEPTCSECTKAVMSIYSQFATNGTLPVSHTYPPAQNKTSATCGDGYSVPVQIANSGLRTASGPTRAIGVGLGLAVGMMLSSSLLTSLIL